MSNYPVIPGSQQVASYGQRPNSGPTRQGPVIDIGGGKKARVRKPEGWVARGFGGAFVAGDAYMRIKDGENPVTAIGKAVLSNALFMSMGPVVGTAAAIGVGALSMAPVAMRAYDAAKANHGSKGAMFGGGFAETEGQTYLKQMGMSNMSGARQQAAAVMSNHARGAFKTY